MTESEQKYLAATVPAAIATMLDRIANPHLPARTIQLNGHLVVRQSCGAQMARQEPSQTA